MKSLLLSLLLASPALAAYDPLPADTKNAPDYNFRLIDEYFSTIMSSLTATVAAVVGNPGIVVRSTSVVNCAFNNALGYIPFDDTIPQITEGAIVLTATMTMLSSTNRIRILVTGNVTADDADEQVIGAVFEDAGAGAVAAGTTYAALRNNAYTLTFAAERPGYAGSKVFTLKLGQGNAVQQAVMNGWYTSRALGGTLCTTMRVEEYVP